MRSRNRNIAQVRIDAIKMALMKANTGCLPCVQGYLELAKENGATEEELKQAIIRDVSEEGNGTVSRRQLLKLAGMVAAGITLSTITTLDPETAGAYSYYYGTDSNTASGYGIPQNFYIGRFGLGVTPSTLYFNTSAANSAGSSNTYEYWGLQGPGSAPSGTSSYDWGQQQGNLAASQWYNNGNAIYVAGRTVFGDVEPGFGGWDSGSTSDKQSVLNGFLDAIQYYSVTSLIPGIYISPSNWQTYFSTGFRPNQYFVLWLTGCQTLTISCAPCDTSCSGTTSQAASVMAAAANNYFGGSRASLLQYWTLPPSCGDYNVAIQSPFSPYSSSTTYQCSGCGSGSGCV